MAERFDALSTRTGKLDDRSNRSLPGRPRPHIQHGLLLEGPHSAISKTNGRGDENHSGITRNWRQEDVPRRARHRPIENEFDPVQAVTHLHVRCGSRNDASHLFRREKPSSSPFCQVHPGHDCLPVPGSSASRKRSRGCGSM